jgi:hypothetical protein
MRTSVSGGYVMFHSVHARCFEGVNFRKHRFSVSEVIKEVIAKDIPTTK